jgi:hypothetical protein
MIPRLTLVLALLSPGAAHGQTVGQAPRGDATAVAVAAIKAAEHPCGRVTGASRMTDGSVRATCSNGETYRIGTLKGELFALRCSAARRMGIEGC